MKKISISFICLLALLALQFNTVFAAPLAAGYLELREVRNDPKGGVIFIFDVVGEFSKADFKGSSLTLGDNRFPVDCNLQGSVLQCTTTRVTAGQYVTLNIGGFIFWVRVPESKPVEIQLETQLETQLEYCYGVYDIYYDIVADDYFWEQFTTHCQDNPANFGDVIDEFNPDYGGNYDYEFLPSSPGCFNPLNLNAYYYVCGF